MKGLGGLDDGSGELTCVCGVGHGAGDVAGIQSGVSMRVQGEGGEAPRPNGKPGSLYLHIRVRRGHRTNRCGGAYLVAHNPL